jgi:DNA-directed RNA polymerase specialized sigma24 family protein
MCSAGSVSVWLGRLKAGDRAAVQQLWERYFHRLVGLARKKMLDVPRRAADEEDVALSAFDSFCRRAEQGRFPRRDWRRNVHASHPPGSDPDAEEPLLARLISREPDPRFAADVAEWYRQLFARLPDDELRTIAQRKLEGYGNEEIATQLDCSLATVERRLRMIRKCWEEELPG